MPVFIVAVRAHRAVGKKLDGVTRMEQQIHLNALTTNTRAEAEEKALALGRKYLPATHGWGEHSSVIGEMSKEGLEKLISQARSKEEIMRRPI